MPAARLDLLIEQGTTFEQKILFEDPENGLPMDLTGWVFNGQIRHKFDSPMVLAAFSFTVENQTTNTGELIIGLTASQTEAMKPKDWTTILHYDIKVTIASKVTRILFGDVRFMAEVTR